MRVQAIQILLMAFPVRVAIVSGAPQLKASTLEQLVQQLGSEAFDERETAARLLEEQGEKALEVLKKAAREDEDPEIRRRAEKILIAIFARLSRESERESFLGARIATPTMAISQDGLLALSGTDERHGCVVHLWEVRSGRGLHLLKGHTQWIMGMTISPDRKRGLTSGSDHPIRMWDLQTGKELRCFTGHRSPVYKAIFVNDADWVVSCDSDKTVRLWDAVSGKQLRHFEGHTSNVFDVVLSPDHKCLLSCGDDKTLRLWDLHTGKELRRLEGHSGPVWTAAFSPNGRFALSGAGGHQRDKSGALVPLDPTVRLWDVSTGTEIRRFEGHEEVVISVAFSPDGRRILSGSGDRTVRLWDVSTGKEIRRFLGHQEGVVKVLFSPDGRRAFSGSRDNVVRIWELPK
jgi:WD40 repeat protein